MKDIKTLICGDSYSCQITFKTNGLLLDHTLINKVTLASCKLELSKELEWNANFGCYYFNLTAEETEAFTPGQYDYDITLEFNDGAIITGVYEGWLSVLAKHNGECENE